MRYTQQGQQRREQAVTAQPGQPAYRRRTNVKDPHHEPGRAPHRINHLEYFPTARVAAHAARSNHAGR